MLSLDERTKIQVMIGLLVALLGVLVYMLTMNGSFGGRAPAFSKQPLAYKLTQKRAVELTLDQMNGTAPLQKLELNTGASVLHQYEPPTLPDILLSMQDDCIKRGFDGICAMNYNIPVAACYMPQLGQERNLVMFNLKMTGFSQDTTEADETSLLCDQGQTKYGYERFKFVWIEFWDQNLDYHFVKIEGRMTRVVQHMAWLNRGVTVCDPMSAQRQADILFQVMNDFRSLKAQS